MTTLCGKKNAENKHKPDKVLETLENYCNPRDNEIHESYRFWNTPYHERFINRAAVGGRGSSFTRVFLTAQP